LSNVTGSATGLVSAFLAVGVTAEHTYRVTAERRVHVLAREVRIYEVPEEVRTTTVEVRNSKVAV
jgi:hypothetical protein